MRLYRFSIAMALYMYFSSVMYVAATLLVISLRVFYRESGAFASTCIAPFFASHLCLFNPQETKHYINRQQPWNRVAFLSLRAN